MLLIAVVIPLDLGTNK